MREIALKNGFGASLPRFRKFNLSKEELALAEDWSFGLGRGSMGCWRGGGGRVVLVVCAWEAAGDVSFFLCSDEEAV